MLNLKEGKVITKDEGKSKNKKPIVIAWLFNIRTESFST
jgi:hypothetical protein